MTIARRDLLLWAAALSAAAGGARAADLGLRAGQADAGPAPPAPRIASAAAQFPRGLDAAGFGVVPGRSEDQSALLQKALEEAARRQLPLALGPGAYRVGGLHLPSGAQLLGVRGATKLLLGNAGFLMRAAGADHVTLSGLVLDGQKRPLRDGLVYLERVTNLKFSDCEILDSGGTALHCVGASGQISDNVINGVARAAIHSLDARGLVIARNTISNSDDNGIQVWRTQPGSDGTQVIDNRVENIRNRSGGSGQYGNAINIFRAGDVVVRGNRIRACAFSAVRGNAASNLTVNGNSISDAREVAIYSEFGFQGALISGNSVDGAAIGISVTNFNDGGRLAVVQGNLIRNLLPKRPAGADPGDGAGIGIYAEADTAISGNVVENAPHAAMVLGNGPYLRDVAATGNVLRRAEFGIGVSVSPGAGRAVIANNIISEMRRGAIVAMDRDRVGVEIEAGRYAHLTLANNSVR
jgi:uncharacterized secreted repeat protein (TIGR03808 family)